MVIYWIHLTAWRYWKKDLRTPLDPDITYSDDPYGWEPFVLNQLNFEIEEESLQSISKRRPY
jgi:hypothetical protein